MANFTYPTNGLLTEIAQDLLPNLVMDDPIFDIFQITEDDTDLLEWEQEGNYIGIQQSAGINGRPLPVQRVDVEKRNMQPGYYREFLPVDEAELTRRRKTGSYNEPIDLTEIVMKLQNQLITRQNNGIIQRCWQLATTGSFTVTINGQSITKDTYALQSYTASTPWSTTASATPLQDFRNVKLKQRGHSVRFDASSTAYMNQTTFNNLTSNTNSADIFGKRTAGLATVIGLEDTNAVLTKEDLPTIKIWDGGYIDDSNTFHTFIPDGKVLVSGKRTDGGQIAKYSMTRNANRSDMGPGIYSYIFDSIDANILPRYFEVHLGHNGGPAVLFPSALVYMSV